MTFPPVLIIIVAVALIFKIYMNKSSKNYDPDREFFERERQADLTPRKSIEDLPYIIVNPDELPLTLPIERPEAVERQETIRNMADKKVLNFTGRSNTDLKLEYGAPNIGFLMTCDMNYTRLVQSIAYLAEDYLNAGYEAEAKELLEYGISINTDVKKNYMLLASLYAKSGELSRITGLLEKAGSLRSLSKNGIIRSLQEYV